MSNSFKTFIYALAIPAALSLSACESTKEQLGLNRQSPDEFAVIKRAPLEMPPSYTLRPPTPGAARPQEQKSQEQARTVVFGSGEEQRAAAPAGAESAILQKAGTDIAQPDIRTTVDRETALLEPKEKPVAQKLLGITLGDDGEKPASIVDAQGEAERLKRNREEGKPVTEGETPSIEE
jgi:hypothetical protein